MAQLCEDGEELVGRIAVPQYLLFVQYLLLATLEGGEAASASSSSSGQSVGVVNSPSSASIRVSPGLPPAWAWWAQRAVLLQQRALAGRSATLRRQLEGLTAQVGWGVGKRSCGRVCRMHDSWSQLCSISARLMLDGTSGTDA